MAGNTVAGYYLDKGFNVKFKYKPKNGNRPNLAIGLDDFAGTGFFTRGICCRNSRAYRI